MSRQVMLQRRLFQWLVCSPSCCRSHGNHLASWPQPLPLCRAEACATDSTYQISSCITLQGAVPAVGHCRANC